MVVPHDISRKVSLAVLYEQLAEECTELAHAALKMARLYRGENPSPCNLYDASNNVKEEFTDLIVVADVLGLNEDNKIYQEKLERWYNRLEGK